MAGTSVGVGIPRVRNLSVSPTELVWMAAQPQPVSRIVTVSSVDTTAPGTNITVGASKSRISRVAGQDVTTFTFTVDEDYQAYQLRVVPSGASPVTAGALLESGSGGTAGAGRAVDVTDAELEAAGGTTGDSIIKVFAQDLAGNWSG